MVGMFAVVDWSPFVTGAEIIGAAVMMGEAVVFQSVSG